MSHAYPVCKQEDDVKTQKKRETETGNISRRENNKRGDIIVFKSPDPRA